MLRSLTLPVPLAVQYKHVQTATGCRAANLVQAALHSSKTPQFHDLSCRESDLDRFSICEVAGVIDQANKGGNHEKDREEIASLRAALDSFDAYCSGPGRHDRATGRRRAGSIGRSRPGRRVAVTK